MSKVTPVYGTEVSQRSLYTSHSSLKHFQNVAVLGSQWFINGIQLKDSTLTSLYLSFHIYRSIKQTGLSTSASTFNEISFFGGNLRNSECLKEFLKEFKKINEIWEKNKDILGKFGEFKEIWVKYRDIVSISRNITISEGLGRVFYLSMSLLLKKYISKSIKLKKDEISQVLAHFAHSHILIFYINFTRHDFETSHY